MIRLVLSGTRTVLFTSDSAHMERRDSRSEPLAPPVWIVIRTGQPVTQLITLCSNIGIGAFKLIRAQRLIVAVGHRSQNVHASPSSDAGNDVVPICFCGCYPTSNQQLPDEVGLDHIEADLLRN